MDPYEVLGVSKDASPEVIKAAYRRKARELHPDINSAPEATVQFQRVQLAHDQLTGKAKMPRTPLADDQRSSSAPGFFSGTAFSDEAFQRFRREFGDNPLFASSFDGTTFPTSFSDFFKPETPREKRARLRRQKKSEKQYLKAQAKRMADYQKQQAQRVKRYEREQKERNRRYERSRLEREARLNRLQKEREARLRQANRDYAKRARAAQKAYNDRMRNR